MPAFPFACRARLVRRTASRLRSSLFAVPLLVAILAQTILLTAILLGPGDLGWQQRLSPYDGGWYRSIAEHGYPADLPAAGQASSLAFSPAYPLAMAVVAGALGISFVAAGLLVNALCGLLAVAGVTALCAQVLPRAQARFAGALWAVLPPVFVLSLTYSEALFVASSTFALLACVQQRWLLAGTLTSLAAVTRPTGAAVVAALTVAALVHAWKRRDGRPLLAVAVAGVLPLTWWGLLTARTGAWNFWFVAQEAGWPGHPFGVATHAALTAVPFAGPPVGPWAVIVAGIVAVSVLLTVLLVQQTRSVAVEVRLPLIVFTLGVLLLVLSAGVGSYSSAPRMLWTAVPLLIPLTTLMTQRPWRLAVAGAGFALAIALAVTVTAQQVNLNP